MIDLTEKTTLDWFSIDLDKMNNLYKSYLTEANVLEAAIEELKECLSGHCNHGRALKKDGTPDKRRRCPAEDALSNTVSNLQGNLSYTYHHDFWTAIGVGRTINSVWE